MFTGLIEFMGVVRGSSPTTAGRRLTVDASAWSHRPDVGASIAVNGCCLTVAEPVTGGLLAFDVVPETLAKTTIGELAPGRRVHLEHSATPSTLLGGHVVQGHVDGVGVVESVVTDGEWRVRLRPPRELMEYVAPKGSIALDGVSLTVAALDAGAGWFEVALIPTTLEKTTLAEWKPGSRCNMEMDAFAKMAVHWLKHFSGVRTG